MIAIRNIRLPLEAGLAGGEALIEEQIIRALKGEQVASWQLVKRSVDARKKHDIHFVATVVVELDQPTLLRADGSQTGSAVPARSTLSVTSRNIKDELSAVGAKRALRQAEEACIKRTNNADVYVYEESPLPGFPRLVTPPKQRPVVVGAGPAGLFCALVLARAGAHPLLLERGGDVKSRKEAVDAFVRDGCLDAGCNIQFGAGGAGTFSDGKLSTTTHKPLIRQVLQGFVEAGAPREILWQAKPHLGTDLLGDIVQTLCEQIAEAGGEIRFNTAAEDFDIRDGRLRGVVANGLAIPCGKLVLAIGHSARDTFETLYRRGVVLEQKAFSMGVRIEHLQRNIDVAQYGSFAGHPALGAADYKLAHHLTDGRGVYTFCMCPGGTVVAAASEQGGVVTNGMSSFARDGANANAGLLAAITKQDFENAHPLAGMWFQRRYERAAFEAGAGGFCAPAQLLGDFMHGSTGKGGGTVVPSYERGVTWTALDGCLPSFVIDSLREAIPVFGRKLRGFDTPDAVLTGVETRSSSPVRIMRDAGFVASVEGLYPCGEGAGYAGGIMSAAVDGLRVAQAVLADLAGTATL